MQKWENKVIASHVADFEQVPPPNLGYTTHPLHGVSGPQAHYPAYVQPPPPPPPQHPLIKSEPSDNRYILSTPTTSYTLPPLPGPQLNGIYRASATPAPVVNSPSTYQAKLPSIPNGVVRPPFPATPQPVNGQSQPQPPRLPQVDGPSSSSSGSPSPPPSLAPRSTHPSLMSSNPQSSPSKQGETEEINSDLDDSDSDAEEEDQEGVTGETDIVFCTYDKVFISFSSLVYPVIHTPTGCTCEK